VAGGTTLLLTTQYLDEADEPADEIVVIDRGQVIAAGTAEQLKDRAQVAERMNLPQERVSAIERAGPGGTEVATLTGYVEALGGRLQIVAEFGGERVVFR